MNEDILDQNPDIVESKVLFKTKVVIIWGIILAIGILFKSMHWVGGSILLVLSSAGLHAYSINGVMQERNNLNMILSILGVIWIFTMVQDLFTDNLNLFSKFGIGSYCVILVVYFIGYYIQSETLKNRIKNT